MDEYMNDVQAEEIEQEIEEKKTSWFTKGLNWVREHKVAVAVTTTCAAVGAFVIYLISKEDPSVGAVELLEVNLDELPAVDDVAEIVEEVTTEN